MVCYLNIKILPKFKEFWLTAGLWRLHWDRISTHLDLGLGGCGNSPSGSTLRLRSTFFGGSDTETDGAGIIALGTENMTCDSKHWYLIRQPSLLHGLHT